MGEPDECETLSLQAPVRFEATGWLRNPSARKLQSAAWSPIPSPAQNPAKGCERRELVSEGGEQFNGNIGESVGVLQ